MMIPAQAKLAYLEVTMAGSSLTSVPRKWLQFKQTYSIISFVSLVLFTCQTAWPWSGQWRAWKATTPRLIRRQQFYNYICCAIFRAATFVSKIKMFNFFCYLEFASESCKQRESRRH
jgi:hypothetical protein